MKHTLIILGIMVWTFAFVLTACGIIKAFHP